MEDDDEFGDLYTDILRPLSAASQPHQTSPAPSSLHLPIDLNIKSNDQDSPCPASVTPPHTLTPESQLPILHAPTRAYSEFTDNNDVKVKFDIEEGTNGISNYDVGIEIPGISQNDVVVKGQGRNEGEKQNDVVGEEEEDDWESDSEDDLQIVLNEENHRPMLIDEGGGDDDDEDEDGDPLVIIADVDANNHQGLVVEEQEWGGDDAAAQMGEGEAEKEGMVERANGAVAATAAAAASTAKIGYSNHFAYHNPYHSQFKYLRPGAAPIPGSATIGTGGAPGQVRPLLNMGAGRGRGDWRPAGMKTAPPMQKGFHPSFGMSASGANMAGRGLEFTLPSHKTIFEVDIDGFEEKPWKHPGVDISDFFNFGLNEESWKDYCKQLEQHRLETTMQSKIRVYESGRDQEYDPDLPPELAAATGILDVPADNANLGKSDVRQSDLTKGPAHMRPPIPTGRAIQVEGGFGDRLPSIDTRPPRVRDSDAIIEIVCQDSVDDDSSTGNGERGNDLPREDPRGDGCGAEDEMGPIDTEYFHGFPDTYDSRKRELVRRGAPYVNVVRDNLSEGNGPLPVPPEAPVKYLPGSRSPTPKYPSENIGTSNEQRRRPGGTGDRSSHMTPSRSPQINKVNDNQDEESVESMEGKHSPSTSPTTVRDARGLSVECKDAAHDELVTGDGSSAMDNEKTNTITTSGNLKDGKALHSLKKQKINSQVEQTELQDFDEEDSRAARSSENSKARSGSSRDHEKWHDGVEDEVMQNGRSRLGSKKKHLEENEQSFRIKDREWRQEMERERMVAKGREGSYPQRNFDPSLARELQMKSEGFDRRKERESSDGVWQRREDELYSRKNRIEDTRKREREHLDEVEPRHRGKARESERTDRDEYLHSRKQSDNGSYRLHYDKDAGQRHRERDDSLKSRYEMVDGYVSKRRKDDEYIKRDHAEKDDILHGPRDSTSRRKRERDDILDQRRREDHQRIRENFDDHLPARHKDEGWLQREREERHREREEWHRLKPHEEILPKREREEGRGAARSGRSSEDRAWVGHARVKVEYKGSDKEYQVRDTDRHGEQLKRRERIEDESLPPRRVREDGNARGNQFSNEERKSRQERSGPRIDRSANTSDNVRVNEKKHKESSRKIRESEVDHNSSVALKRNQEDRSGHVSELGVKGTLEQGNGVNEKPVHRNSSRKPKEEASSEDEQQDSRRGRSKLERWTSRKERDFSINSKSSDSQKFKEINKNNSGRTLETTKLPEESVTAVETTKLPEDPVTAVEPVDERYPLANEIDGGNPKIKGAETKPADDRHLDTVEKLKKRSERFKLPMPIEKDTLAIKKMESEPLPSTKSETPVESEIKQERPARKRRWISS